MNTQNKINFIQKDLDNEDVSALIAYLNTQVMYKGFWIGVDKRHIANAITAWTGGVVVKVYPENGGNNVLVDCRPALKSRESIDRWISEWMDIEQIGLIRKALANSRRKRRVYLDGDLYHIRYDLKRLFNARWSPSNYKWHVHYKKADAAKEFIKNNKLSGSIKRKVRKNTAIY